MARSLRLIGDRQAIHNVIVRYCRGVDRSDPDLVLTAFHEDVIDNHNNPVLSFSEAIGTWKAVRKDRGAPTSKTTSMHTRYSSRPELSRAGAEVAARVAPETKAAIAMSERGGLPTSACSVLFGRVTLTRSHNCMIINHLARLRRSGSLSDRGRGL